MQLDTAKMLLETIANALNIAVDSQNKLLAFEKTLKDRDLALFQEYEKNLEIVRQNPPTVILPLGFANLQSKLVQD